MEKFLSKIEILKVIFPDNMKKPIKYYNKKQVNYLGIPKKAERYGRDVSNKMLEECVNAKGKGSLEFEFLRERFILFHVRYVLSIVSNYSKRHYLNIDDITGCAILALVFSCDKLISMGSHPNILGYIYISVNGEILNYIKSFYGSNITMERFSERCPLFEETSKVFSDFTDMYIKDYLDAMRFTTIQKEAIMLKLQGEMLSDIENRLGYGFFNIESKRKWFRHRWDYITSMQ